MFLIHEAYNLLFNIVRLRCWKAFGKIHEVVRTPELLFEATCEIIKEFVNDNVVYLELRTTPKKIHAIPSKKVYIETVIRAIRYVYDNNTNTALRCNMTN